MTVGGRGTLCTALLRYVGQSAVGCGRRLRALRSVPGCLVLQLL